MVDEISSPLQEVDPTSLDELFRRLNEKLITGLPETITEADLLPLVKHLQERRAYFLIEQDRLGRAPNPRSKATPKSGGPAITVDADEL